MDTQPGVNADKRLRPARWIERLRSIPRKNNLIGETFIHTYRQLQPLIGEHHGY
jgi:hypothetical protein